MPEPHLRAADADRSAVATALGEHMAAGRLTVAEYEERLARAYAAKTYGELAELTADLPTTGTAPVPVDAGSAPAPRGRWGAVDVEGWRTWASTALIVTMIWGITSLASWEFLYFWPIWVIGPWGAVLLIDAFFGDDDEDEDEDEDDEDDEPGPEALPGR